MRSNEIHGINDSLSIIVIKEFLDYVL